MAPLRHSLRGRLTGIKMLQAADREPDLRRNLVLRSLRRHLRVTETYEGRYFLVRRDGALHVTPLFLVLVLVEFSDILFAIDSIPAVLAITTDPFMVYTSNVFAILGLRALYFALAGIVPRFIYLRLLLGFGVMRSGLRRPAPRSRSRATPFPVCEHCERTGRSQDRAAASPARCRDAAAARIAGATRSPRGC